MNREALQKARDLLAVSSTYDQTLWRHDCRTPACVAGFIVVANSSGRLPKRRLKSKAMQLAELSVHEANRMFYAFPVRPVTTREQALAMLDHAIEHGEVRWGAPAIEPTREDVL